MLLLLPPPTWLMLVLTFAPSIGGILLPPAGANTPLALVQLALGVGGCRWQW